MTLADDVERIAVLLRGALAKAAEECPPAAEWLGCALDDAEDALFRIETECDLPCSAAEGPICSHN